MLMQLQRYNDTFLNHPGKKIYLADTLLIRVFIHGMTWEYEDKDDVRESEYIPVTDSLSHDTRLLVPRLLRAKMR